MVTFRLLPYRGLAQGVWGWSLILLPSLYVIATQTRFGDLRPFQFIIFEVWRGIWGWSFPFTIRIWNSDETRFGDLRAFPDFIFEVWQGHLGMAISLLPSQYGIATKPVLLTCGPSRPYFRGLARVSGGWSFPITIPVWNCGRNPLW